ncbi:MAG: lipoyl synthase [Pseudomonadota bacterium]
MQTLEKKRIPKPAWLKRNLPNSPDYENVRRLLRLSGLNTVCQEAKCPNMWECFSKKTSTFMIMGAVCTRDCRFCNVATGTPGLLDPQEPVRVATAARDLGLEYVVVTSVTRDDLKDGGSSHFSFTISEIRSLMPEAGIEVLIPDFQGNPESIDRIIKARPQVINHNIETVPSLYSRVRPQADYQRSLSLMRRVSQASDPLPVKSGIMVGLGETLDELVTTFEDLLNSGCSLLTIGQYLQPSRNHLPVDKYYPPEEFSSLKEKALEIGFANVAAGPFVRSSYQAQALCTRARLDL